MHQGRQTRAKVIHKTKGKIKQAVGDLTGNKKAQARGREGRTQSRVEGAVKDAKRAVNKRIRT